MYTTDAPNSLQYASKTNYIWGNGRFFQAAFSNLSLEECISESEKHSLQIKAQKNMTHLMDNNEKSKALANINRSIQCIVYLFIFAFQ